MITKFLLGSTIVLSLGSPTAMVKNFAEKPMSQNVLIDNNQYKTTFQTPNTWNDLWTDICIVNSERKVQEANGKIHKNPKMDPNLWKTQNTGTPKEENSPLNFNLMYFKESLEVTNDKLNEKDGTLYTVGTPEKIGNERILNEEINTYTNNTDRVLNSPESSYLGESKATTSWSIKVDASYSFKINAIFVKHKVALNLSGVYGQESEVTKQNSVVIKSNPMSPKSKLIVYSKLSESTIKKTGGILIDIKNNPKWAGLVWMTNDNWKSYATIDLFKTLDSIRDYYGNNSYFKKGDDNLFVYDPISKHYFYNIPITWTTDFARFLDVDYSEVPLNNN